jgi:hypothetical protein
MKKKVTNLQKFVISFRRKCGYLLSQIGNADQIPVVFMILDFPTIEHAGDRSAQVRMMGAHKH